MNYEKLKSMHLYLRSGDVFALNIKKGLHLIEILLTFTTIEFHVVVPPGLEPGTT